ncbi:MAG: lysine exporter LysO family protein [Calditerrivibrio sp.]|nr:lysine exporter LysO family protein [Calditerrivibrio sp.]
MIKYLLFISIGGVLGYISRRGINGHLHKHLMNGSIIILLFFMGVGIGKDPDLKSKIADFGITAGVISLLTVVGSTVSVYVILRVFRRRN